MDYEIWSGSGTAVHLPERPADFSKLFQKAQESAIDRHKGKRYAPLMSPSRWYGLYGPQNRREPFAIDLADNKGAENWAEFESMIFGRRSQAAEV